MLEKFLRTEIAEVNTSEQDEMYQAIRSFITSYEIRRGEFEANIFIINKINKDSFCIYEEYETTTKTIYSQQAIVIDRESLLKSIDDEARKIGLHVPDNPVL